MGLHFILETYAFNQSPPLPIVVRLSWHYHPKDEYYYNLSIERLDANSDEEFLYDSFEDENLRAPQHEYYLKFFKKLQIYIPFEIYQNFENYSICSEAGLARWQEITRYPTDIAILALEHYSGKRGAEDYYKHFEELIHDPDIATEPLLSFISDAEEYDDEDAKEYDNNYNDFSTIADNQSTDADENHPDYTSLPRKNKSDVPQSEHVARWKETFFRLNAILKKSYSKDSKVQEAAFIYMANLFMNNGNYSNAEKSSFHFPGNPLEDKNNEYLRSNLQTPVFEKAKNILKLDKKTLFVNVDAQRLQDILANYFTVTTQAITDVTAENIPLDMSQNPTALQVIFLTGEQQDNIKAQIEGCYTVLKTRAGDGVSLEDVKSRYIFCYVKEFSGVYALCSPAAHKTGFEQLGCVISLGFGANLIKFYRALFRWCDDEFKKDKKLAGKETIFYQLWGKLYSDLNKNKQQLQKFPDNKLIQQVLKGIVIKPHEGNLYWSYIVKIFATLKIEQLSITDDFDVFILQEFYQSLSNVEVAKTLDDLVIEFQTFLDALLLFLNHTNTQISFSGSVENIFSAAGTLPPVQTHISNYGMTTFSTILETQFACFKVKEINVFNQVYFELLENLQGLNHQNIKYCKHTNDVSQQADIIFIDPHPNNAVETELYSHQIQQILQRCYPDYQNRLGAQSFGIKSYSRRLTLVIDVTLNILLDEELKRLLNTVAPLIDAGLVNLVLVQSLTKFSQLGADKLSAGAIYLFNQGDYWDTFNQQLLNNNKLVQVDPLVECYFALFFRTNDLLINYRKKIAENTNFFHRRTREQLNQLVFGQQFLPMDLTESTDNHSCYLSFNYRYFIGNAHQNSFFSDDDIVNLNREIITLIEELSHATCVPLTRRQSIGFPTSNINECLFAIRLVIGLESQEELASLSDMFIYICYAFSFGHTFLKSKEEYLIYLEKVKNIFIACVLQTNLPEIELGNFVIQQKIPVRQPQERPNVIGFVMHYKKTPLSCYLSPSTGCITAQSGEKTLPVHLGQIKEGEVKIVNNEELLPLTRALLSLFIMNYELSKCKLAFKATFAEGVVITNFIDLINPERRSFFYRTQRSGLLQFVLENNRLALLNNGHQLLSGAQVAIHQSVLENLGIIFSSSNSTHVIFDDLPTEQKRRCFLGLEKTKLSFEYALNRYFQKNLPKRVYVEAFSHNSENGFILESHVVRGSLLTAVNLYVIKHPVLNLYCQCVCLLAIYDKVVDFQFDGTTNLLLFTFKNIARGQLTAQFQEIISSFIKIHHKISGLFKSHDSPYLILAKIIQWIPGISHLDLKEQILPLLVKVFPYMPQRDIEALKRRIFDLKGKHPGFFDQQHNELVSRYRHHDSEQIIQHAYDKIYGLALS